MKTLQGNIFKSYLFRFFYMFLVIIPVIIPFFLSKGLTMSQIFLLQASFGITTAIFEVPSGYLSDIWGRKKTLMIGSLFEAAGFTYLLFANTYFDFILYEIILAIGLSLISGTDISILYDSLEFTSAGKENTTKAMSHLQFMSALAETIGSILGGFLVLISFKAVIIANAIVSYLPFLVALTIVEPPVEKLDKTKHRENFKIILHHIFKKDKILTLVFFNQIIWGLATFVAVWVYQKYWQDSGVSMAYFGIIWAAYNLTHGIVSKWVHYFEHRVGASALLITLSLLPIAGYLGIGYFSGVMGIVIGLFFQVSRGITQVLLKDALNWRTPSGYRATVNSIVSLFFRLGFCLIGPLTGLFIDTIGLSKSMYLLAGFFAVMFFLFTIPLSLRVKKMIPES